ncbi:MAG: NUDIX hydrolase [Nitrospiraceae bacterium]|jgi:8-oxo-dGTP pyrophosphatase MutT (NUDIX family)|nr:NUDIX hydrolase [Nitrospiraceae bacterium]
MEIVQRTIAWEGRFIRCVLLTYRDTAGELRSWEAVERVNCNGIVVVIPVTTRGEFIFIRQFRPVLNRHVIEFPAGLNDRDERLQDVALRELVEETGYTSERIALLAEGPVSSGLSTEITTVYLAHDARPAPAELRAQFQPDESEDIEVFLVPIEQAYERLGAFTAAGDCIDLKMFGFIERAKAVISSRTLQCGTQD